MKANNEEVIMSVVNCTISFVDGEQLSIAWPKREDASMRAGRVLEMIMANQSLAIELEGRLVLIPVQNIRTVEVRPAPEKLPDTVIRGARIV
jgi:hypothetical protein